jgi:DNA polymerase-3 subunit beta
LGDSAIISIRQQQQQAVVQSGRSRFVLQSLLVADFPSNEGFINETEINLSQNSLRYFLSKTQFAIAQQDARPALNGLLIEIKDQRLNFVATDGFRLAFASEIFIENQLVNNRILLPRKTVLELLKILNNSEEMVKIQLNQQQVRFSLPDLRLTSRLIDRPYPDYEVILAHQASAIITLDCQQFKQILQRVAILYDEQYKGARLEFSPNLLKVSASNPEHEQAFDEMDIDYNGDNFEVGFNVMYLLDALACIDTAKVQLHISGVYSSYLLCPQDSQNPQYAIMPMRL